MKAPVEYPRSALKYNERPIRLINAKTQKCIRHQNFKYVDRAMNKAAAFVTNWAKIGTVVEVYNARSGKLWASYTKKPGGSVTVWIEGK